MKKLMGKKFLKLVTYTGIAVRMVNKTMLTLIFDSPKACDHNNLSPNAISVSILNNR